MHPIQYYYYRIYGLDLPTSSTITGMKRQVGVSPPRPSIVKKIIIPGAPGESIILIGQTYRRTNGRKKRVRVIVHTGTYM